MGNKRKDKRGSKGYEKNVMSVALSGAGLGASSGAWLAYKYNNAKTKVNYYRSI
jgi:hypothetical protein